jgi:hypothetical protein
MSSIRTYICPNPYTKRCETAFHERRKIHDLIMEGIGLALRKARLFNRRSEGRQEAVKACCAFDHRMMAPGNFEDRAMTALPSKTGELCGILGDEAIRRRGLPAFG